MNDHLFLEPASWAVLFRSFHNELRRNWCGSSWCERFNVGASLKSKNWWNTVGFICAICLQMNIFTVWWREHEVIHLLSSFKCLKERLLLFEATNKRSIFQPKIESIKLVLLFLDFIDHWYKISTFPRRRFACVYVKNYTIFSFLIIRFIT